MTVLRPFTMTFSRITALLLAAAIPVSSATAAPPADPLESVMWEDVAERFFGDAKVVFDDRVKVQVPSIVENQAQVPVTVDARVLPNVQKLIVFADLNPIIPVLKMKPVKAKPYISFRMKVEQGTPLRAAALTDDGVWHVGGLFLDAAGGGCSAPATVRQLADWSDTVGQTQARMWRDIDGTARVRLRLRHPMDTGLAKDNTPAYYIEKMELRGSSGEALAELEMFEPVSEDPTLTLLLRLAQSDSGIDVKGRDNNGGVYKSTVPASWKQSQALD
jgi:sulfur-oxidizing protein SoxY